MELHKFNYDCYEARVTFKVDREKFRESAQQTLDFWTWDYDEDADPVDEALKKYAIECIREATSNGWNTFGVKNEFERKEGWTSLDGKYGIELIYVEGYEYNEDALEVEVEKV